MRWNEGKRGAGGRVRTAVNWRFWGGMCPEKGAVHTTGGLGHCEMLVGAQRPDNLLAIGRKMQPQNRISMSAGLLYHSPPQKGTNSGSRGRVVALSLGILPQIVWGAGGA